MGCACAVPDVEAHTLDLIVGGGPTKCSEDCTFGHMLGQGAMGVVYAATARSAATEVAVTIVDMSGKTEGKQHKAQEEVDLWRSIGAHPNIVELHGSFIEEQRLYIAMDKCQCTVAAYMLLGVQLLTSAEAKIAVMEGKPPRKLWGVTELYDSTEAAFVAFLLQREPDQRLGADTALYHPCLARTKEQAMQTKTKETLAPLEDDNLQDDEDEWDKVSAPSVASADHSS